MRTLNVEIDKSQYKKKNCLTCRHSDTNNNGISCKESYPIRWETCNQHYSLYKPVKPILHLVLKHKWYEKIKSGEKKTEYRSYSRYWNKRFKLDDLLESVNYGSWEEPYDIVVFHKGYTSETITFRIKKISCKVDIPNDLDMSPVWVIELGERLK